MRTDNSLPQSKTEQETFDLSSHSLAVAIDIALNDIDEYVESVFGKTCERYEQLSSEEKLNIFENGISSSSIFERAAVIGLARCLFPLDEDSIDATHLVTHFTLGKIIIKALNDPDARLADYAAELFVDHISKHVEHYIYLADQDLRNQIRQAVNNSEDKGFIKHAKKLLKQDLDSWKERYEADVRLQDTEEVALKEVLSRFNILNNQEKIDFLRRMTSEKLMERVDAYEVAINLLLEADEDGQQVQDTALLLEAARAFTASLTDKSDVIVDDSISNVCLLESDYSYLYFSDAIVRANLTSFLNRTKNEYYFCDYVKTLLSQDIDILREHYEGYVTSKNS